MIPPLKACTDVVSNTSRWRVDICGQVSARQSQARSPSVNARARTPECLLVAGKVGYLACSCVTGVVRMEAAVMRSVCNSCCYGRAC